MNNIEEIIKIIRDEASMTIEPDTEITSDTDLISDLHIDSLDMMLIIGDIEQKFDIVIDNTEIQNVRTVKDIANKISEMKS